MAKDGTKQKTRTVTLEGSEIDPEIDKAEAMPAQMLRLAKTVLTTNQWLIFNEVLTFNTSFKTLGKKLKLSTARVAQLWGSARIRVDNAWQDTMIKSANSGSLKAGRKACL